MKLSGLDLIVSLLLIIGGINWGLIGLFNFDLVATIFGFAPMIVRLVYIVVGLSALYSLYSLTKAKG
jgi:hypothetical protein